MTDERGSQLLALVGSHEKWRGQTLNLIASENVLSGVVRRSLNSDLLQRYADYPGRNLRERRYRGNRYIVEIEEEANALAREAFGAEHVELRPLSGHLAGVAVLLGLCAPGDCVLEVGRDGGGHRESARLAGAPLIDLQVKYLPFDGARYNVDVPRAVAMIHELRPRMVILGASNFLFPHPIADLAAAARQTGTMVVYDASHVMGFVASGLFQHPLGEGADLVFGSTHKTFPGPQGGLIYSDRADLIERVSAALVPSLVTNHHTFRMPALALALIEMRAFGRAYFTEVIDNARALAAGLARRGIRVIEVDGRATDSHTILADVSPHGSAEQVAERLESAGIITTHALLPAEWGTEGIRLGSQEVTRRGADQQFMDRVAGLIFDAITDARSAPQLAGEVADLVQTLGAVRFALAGDPL